MKKIISIIVLVCVMALSLTSCDMVMDVINKVTGKEPTEQKEPYDPNKEVFDGALKLIEDGNIEEAYDILKGLEGYEPAEAELEKFYFVPVSFNYTSEGVSVLSYDIEYNERDLLSKLTTNQEGKVYVWEFTYDDNGNMIRSTTSNLWGELQATMVQEFDENNNVIEATAEYEDGRFEYEEYTYNSDGKLINYVYTDYKGIITTIEYTYSSDGEHVIREHLKTDGNTQTTTRVYDTEGKILEETIRVPAQILVITTQYTYNENGIISKKTVSGKYKYAEILSEVYTYDENGNLKDSQVKTTTDNTYRSYAYNKDNQCVIMLVSTAEGRINVTYTYDEYGSIVKLEEVHRGTTIGEMEVEWKMVYFANGLPKQTQDIVDSVDKALKLQ